MRKYILATVVVAVMGSLGSAQASIHPSTERDLVRICKALKDGSRIKLYKSIKHSRQNYRALVKGLKCNGQDPVAFALSHGSHKAAMLMAKKGRVDLNTRLAKN